MQVAEVSQTVGVILNGALTTIENTLNSTTEDPYFLIYSGLAKARACMQAHTLISNVHEALGDRCSVKPEKETQILMQRVNDFVQLLKTGISVDLASISEKVEQLAQAGKPFLVDTSYPELKSIGPQFVAAQLMPDSTIYKADIIFKGRFPYGSRSDCATFTFNGKEYSPIATTEGTIRFSVEIPNKYCYLKGELKIYYRSGWSFWANSSHCYKTLHGILPDSPVRVTVRYASPDMNKEGQQRKYTSQAMQMGSKQTYECECHPTPGWAFVPNSIKGEYLISPSLENFVRRSPLLSGGFVSKSVPAETWPTGTYRYIAQEVPAKTRDESTVLKWGQTLTPQSDADEFVSEYAFEAFDGFKIKNPIFVQTKNLFMSVIVDGQQKIEIKASTSDSFNKSVIQSEPFESKE